MVDTSKVGEIKALLEVGKEGDEPLAAIIDAYNSISMGRTRLHVAMIVVCGYVITIGLIVLFLIVRGIWFGDDVFGSLIELVKVGLVPITTLVIAFYFGTLVGSR